jgi:hypothetical protein
MSGQRDTFGTRSVLSSYGLFAKLIFMARPEAVSVNWKIISESLLKDNF